MSVRPDPDQQVIPCPLCNSPATREILRLDAMPVNIGLLCDTKEEALAATCHPITLQLCRTCGFVWNHTFDASVIGFEPGYEISLHFSPVYEHFLEQTARRLTDRWELQGKTIVEVGCGSGHFLKLMCETGNCHGFGFDPAVEREGTETGDGWEMKLIRDFYSEQYRDIEPDFICSRHVLHTAGSPAEFVASICAVIGRNRPVPVYFEVPNAVYAFDAPLRWNIMYEYDAYFNTHTLRRLFASFDFSIQAVAPCFTDDQYLYIEAVANGGSSARENDEEENSAFIAHAEEFGRLMDERTAFWRQELKKLSGKKVIAWGAGGRAICFFNVVGITDDIPAVVDINPSRQGKYLPVTGQRVIAPEELKTLQPDLIVVSNPTYLTEIRQTVDEMGLHPEFAVI